MKAIDYMHKIKAVRRRIRLLEEQIERDTVMASGVTAIRYDRDVVQTSPVGDRMTDIVAKIIDATKNLEDEIQTLQLYEEDSIEFLMQLPEEHERALVLHYFNGMKWSDVAEAIGYDGKYIYEVKDAALEELDKLLTESEQI